MGILISYNVYIIKNLGLKISKSALSGTTLSVVSSTCASCSSLGFILASTFGGVGVVTSNFLSNNQTSLWLISIAILFALYTYYTKIRNSCTLRYRFQNDKSSKLNL